MVILIHKQLRKPPVCLSDGNIIENKKRSQRGLWFFFYFFMIKTKRLNHVFITFKFQAGIGGRNNINNKDLTKISWRFNENYCGHILRCQKSPRFFYRYCASSMETELEKVPLVPRESYEHLPVIIGDVVATGSQTLWLENKKKVFIFLFYLITPSVFLHW